MATRQNRRNRQTRRKNRRNRRGGNFVTQFMRNNLGINAFGPSTSKAADDIMKAPDDVQIRNILSQEGLNIENVKRDLRDKGADWKLNLKVDQLKPRSQLNPLPSHLDYDRPIPESKPYIPSLM